MALIAIIPPGVTEIKVNGLHQWDYGQELEIHCDEIPTIVEVHFACFGMIEADVRTCTVANGVAKVSIPDICIEQTTPITAWVYCIDGTSARTTITITLPIIPRAKPAPSASVPTFISDKYTELVSAINEQVGALQNGGVMAARARAATTAESANHANTAGHANTADHSNSADTANSAASATYATSAGSATNTPFIKMQKISSYQITNGRSGEQVGDEFKDNVIYFICFVEVNATYSGICYWNTDTDYNAFSLGDCIGEFVTGGGGRELLIKENGTLRGNGTLTVYKLGEV